MSEETPATSHRRAFWLMLGLFLLVGGGLLGLMFATSTPPRRFSSPTTERPWAKTAFDQTFDPAHQLPSPTLLTSPVPEIKMTTKVEPPGTSGGVPRPIALEVIHETPDGSVQQRSREIFPADVGTPFQVTLPDGTALTLTGIALMLPSDVAWGDQRYPQKIPDWVDPASGDRLPQADWQSEESVPHDGPCLFLMVEKSGPTPLRWHWPEAFDARSLDQISSTSSHSSTETHGMFSIDLDIWHQTPLKLGIQFAFGNPETQSLKLQKGASVKFGDDGALTLLEILPRGHTSSSWGGNGINQKATFDFPVTTDDRDRRSLIFQIWPPQNDHLMEFVGDPSKRGRFLSGNGGITSVELSDKDTAMTDAQIRRFPRLGRAVFDLARIPRLPEVTNLFDSPIPRTEIRYSNDLTRAAVDAAEMRIALSNYQNLPESDFPMVLTDTTPGEILREYERLTHTTLYLDEVLMQFSDKKPPGPLEKLKAWWKRTKPGWLP